MLDASINSQIYWHYLRQHLEFLKYFLGPILLCLVSLKHPNLVFLFLYCSANNLRRSNGWGALFVQEGIDSDNWELPSMFQHFIVQAFLLDFTALVHGLHRTQHATTLRNAIKLLQYRLFDQIRQFLDNEGTLNRISFFAKPNSLLMINWMAIARRTLSSVGAIASSWHSYAANYNCRKWHTTPVVLYGCR